MRMSAMRVAGGMSMEGWACCLVRRCRRAWGRRRRERRGRGAGLGRLLRRRRWWRRGGGRRMRRDGSCQWRSRVWCRLQLCPRRLTRGLQTCIRNSRMSPWRRGSRLQYLLQMSKRHPLPLSRMEDGLLLTTPRSDGLLSSMPNHEALLGLFRLRLRLVRSQRGNSALLTNYLASSDEGNSRQWPRRGE